jgi:hypothetical protein
MGQKIFIIFKYIIGGLIVAFGAVVAYLAGEEWGLREGVFVAAAYYSALGVLFVMFKETALARFKRPILTTNFEMRRPFITLENDERYWYHIGVTNTGRSTAKDCSCYLNRIYIYNDNTNKYEENKNFLTTSLQWIREEGKKTFIQPKQTKYIDISWVSLSPQPFFNLYFAGGIYSDVNELGVGQYKINIGIYSTNANGVNAQFKLDVVDSNSIKIDKFTVNCKMYKLKEIEIT